MGERVGGVATGVLPSVLAWATIVLGATQLTPIGFLGSLLIPPWLIVVGIWLFRPQTSSTDHVLGRETAAPSTRRCSAIATAGTQSTSSRCRE